MEYICYFIVQDNFEVMFFESDHRAGSKANKDDAMFEIYRRYGRYVGRRAEIESIKRAR